MNTTFYIQLGLVRALRGVVINSLAAMMVWYSIGFQHVPTVAFFFTFALVSAWQNRLHVSVRASRFKTFLGLA